MNQILSVDMPNRGNNKPPKKKAKAQTKSVLIAFCIILLLFGILLIAIGLLNISKEEDTNVATTDDATNETSEETVEEAINIEVIVGSSSLDVTVTSDVQLDNIVYNWNEEEGTQVNVYEETSYELEITIPEGTNTLYIIATDINGESESFSNEYTGTAQDFEPTIELAQDENTLIATITSDTTISSVSYAIDDEDEISEEINDSTAEVSIDITSGEYALSITVVSEDGGVYTDSKSLYIPSVKVVTDRKDFIIQASDSAGLEKIEYTLYTEDDEKSDEITVSDSDGDSITEYEAKVELEDGENKIKVIVYNEEGGSYTVRYRFDTEED